MGIKDDVEEQQWRRGCKSEEKEKGGSVSSKLSRAPSQLAFSKKKSINELRNLEKAKSDPKIRTRSHKGRKPKIGLTGLRKNNVQKTTGAVDIRIP